MFSKEILEAAKDALEDKQVMTDGGIPEFLTADPADEHWDSYEAYVTYEIPGTLAYDVEDENLPRRDGKHGTINSDEEVTMDFTEELGASIINVEAWLHDHWLETIMLGEYHELSDGRQFLADVKNAEVAIDFNISEVIKASRQRAIEDSTHFLYVLGNWTYLAEKNDHVKERTGQKLRRAFERGKQNCVSPPNDATCDEFGGGGR